MSGQRIERGRKGEQLAAEFLKKRGYRIVERNYRRRTGEIDIIALDGDTYVFIEVKTRSSDRYGDPAEAVTPAKQRQISNAARAYLSQHGLYDKAVRFDVIGINLCSAEPAFNHLVSAFEAIT